MYKPLLAVLLVACVSNEPTYNEDWIDYSEPTVDAFARGERFQDQAVTPQESRGVALTEGRGAVGMNDAICNFEVEDARVGFDLAGADGSEIVVDAVAVTDGFDVVARRGDVVVFGHFEGGDPQDDRGSYTETFTVEGLSDVGVTTFDVVTTASADGSCSVQRRDTDLSSIDLPGDCVALDVDSDALVSTTEGTFRITPDLRAVRIGPTATQLTTEGRSVALVTDAGLQVQGEADWTFASNEITGLGYLADGELVVGERSRLLLFSPKGELLETVDTASTVNTLTTDPTTNMVAIESYATRKLHIVTVL